MTFEFFFFIVLCILLFLLIFQRENKEVGFAMWIFMFLVGSAWFYIVRIQGPDVDINTYYRVLSEMAWYDFKNDYFLREFVSWGGLFSAYQLFNDLPFAFFIIDTFLIFILIKTTVNFNLPVFFFILFLCIFPNIMGSQNIYRQYIATVFFLYSISIIYNNVSCNKNCNVITNNFWGFFAFLVAFFSHNVIGVFFPILFIILRQYFFMFVFSLFSIFMMIYMASTKSEGVTGYIDSYFFYIVIFSLCVIYFFKERLIIKKIYLNEYVVVLYLLILNTVSYVFLSSVATKRIILVSFDILLIFIFIIIKRNDRGINRRLQYILCSILFIAPIILSDAVLDFLFTANQVGIK
ncbi:hypothetical protein ACWIUH_02960 [Ursidibacter arcticus]